MMKNKLRRGLALLGGGLLLGLIQTVPVSAEMEESPDDLWTLRDYDDGTVSVSLNDKSLENVEIPAKINGKTITMVEVDCFNGCENLTSVTLPDSITVIEDYSFYNCPKLQSISIPRNVYNIGFQAFYGCFALEEINIPAAVTEIEAFAFEGCNALQSVHVAEDNSAYKDEDGILFDIEGKTLILYPSAKEGTEYTVPEGCTRVEDYAFMGCTNLQTVNIDKIQELGEDAFYHCTSLKSIRIPDTITELQGSVFGDCNSLEQVQLPSGLQSIGEGCFYSCFVLPEIDIPETVTSIGNYAFFNCGTLKSIRLTKAVTSIGDYALGFCFTDGEELTRIPGFQVDAADDTAAFDYCVKNEIKCTGGVTQGTVFIYIIIIVVVLVIAIVVTIIIVQKKIQKKYYDLN